MKLSSKKNSNKNKQQNNNNINKYIADRNSKILVLYATITKRLLLTTDTWPYFCVK